MPKLNYFKAQSVARRYQAMLETNSLPEVRTAVAADADVNGEDQIEQIMDMLLKNKVDTPPGPGEEGEGESGEGEGEGEGNTGGDIENFGDDLSKSGTNGDAQTQPEENKEEEDKDDFLALPKGSYMVEKDFADKDKFQRMRRKGEDVSHFNPDRLAHLVKIGYVVKK